MISKTFVLLIVCVMPLLTLGKSCGWSKLNSSPVCFEASNNRPGTFHSTVHGFVAAVKLVHIEGKVTCDYRLGASLYSNWGCHNLPRIEKYPLNVFITDQSNRILFPKVGATYSPVAHKIGRWYSIPGFNSKSSELVLKYGFNDPLYIANQNLKLWYGEDLFNYREDDNRGRVCADVYGYIL